MVVMSACPSGRVRRRDRRPETSVRGGRVTAVSPACHPPSRRGRTRSGFPMLRRSANPSRERTVVEYEILGPLTVQRPDGAVVPSSARQRLLLGRLLLGCARVVGSDRLIEELWGDDPPQDAAAALRNQ